MIDTAAIKARFPIFSQQTPLGEPLIYLDNAATTQKPQSVIEAISHYYAGYNSNVGRGSYWPATAASKAFADAREKVRGFINAGSIKEVIYTSGTTDGINKVMNKYFLPMLKPGDEVITTEMEHHGNFVPWQQACQQSGASLKVVPLTENGEVDYLAFEQLLNDRTKMVAITAVSNTLGTCNDLERLIQMTKKVEAKVLVDAAQLVTHRTIDVQALDCDFLVFSAHKLFGPTGIGVLYGKEAQLEAMPPLAFGGGMVKSVSIGQTSFADLPQKHEGGTAHIAGAIGLGAAIDFVNEIGLDAMHGHTQSIMQYAEERLKATPGVTVLATPVERASLLSFVVDGAHPHDVASFLAEKGIAIRAGHHCTHPLMQHLKLPGTCRASFGIYNTKEEIDSLVKVLEEVRDFFA